VKPVQSFPGPYEREKHISGAGACASSAKPKFQELRAKQALAGRAAWGVLGSAAGGHVVLLNNKNPEPGSEFLRKLWKSWAGARF